MLPITDFPQLVEHYASFFESVFSEAGFVQFKRYISGLLVSENKTIAGINQLFVNPMGWMTNSGYTNRSSAA